MFGRKKTPATNTTNTNKKNDNLNEEILRTFNLFAGLKI